MNQLDQELRYLEVSRRQLQREMDEMGYGQHAQRPELPVSESSRPTGVIMALATIAILFVSLSLSSLIL